MRDPADPALGHDVAATWLRAVQTRSRALPEPSREHLNSARPDDPNLLFTFRTRCLLRTAAGRRSVRCLGGRVAQPDRVVEHWRWSGTGTRNPGDQVAG